MQDIAGACTRRILPIALY